MPLTHKVVSLGWEEVSPSPLPNELGARQTKQLVLEQYLQGLQSLRRALEHREQLFFLGMLGKLHPKHSLGYWAKLSPPQPVSPSSPLPSPDTYTLA